MNLNEIKDNYGWSPLLWSIYKDNDEMFKSLINYAEEHNILLDLNSQTNNGYYPLLEASSKDYKILELLLKYANEHNITLEMNKRDDDGWYPILGATVMGKYNRKVESLFEYAEKHDIKLELDVNDIKKYCDNWNIYYWNYPKYSEISPEILELWKNYGKTEVT